ATDSGLTTPRMPSDRQAVGATDNICRQRNKISLVMTGDQRAAAAKNDPSKLALIADTASRQYATVRDDKAAGKPAPANTIDIEQLSNNFVRLIEQGGKAMAAYLKPREEGRLNSEATDEVIGVVKTFGHVAEYWFAH